MQKSNQIFDIIFTIFQQFELPHAEIESNFCHYFSSIRDQTDLHIFHQLLSIIIPQFSFNSSDFMSKSLQLFDPFFIDSRSTRLQKSDQLFNIIFTQLSFRSSELFDTIFL
jgi:hypothetical protein